MNGKYKIAIIIISAIFVVWIGITGANICVFTAGPTPIWLGSHSGCGPYITHEIQKNFGILGYEPEPRLMESPTHPNISYEGEPSARTLLPYTENYNVPFDYEGRINYDLLIKKLLPPIFQNKLTDMGVDVETSHMVLLSVFQSAMYRESSYQCGYVIDDDNQVYWFEGRINKSEIHDVQVFTENPKPCKPNTGSCWCDAQTLAEEQLLSFEKTYLSPTEEQTVVNYIHDYLKNNPNLNSYKYKIGKYHVDYGDDNIIPFCGMFEEKEILQFFEGSVNLVINENGFGLEKRPSPLCVIADDAKWNSFD